MGFKFLPTKDVWEKALATVNVKPDQAPSKALSEWFRVDADQPAKRLATLPNINKLASEFKKSPRWSLPGRRRRSSRRT